MNLNPKLTQTKTRLGKKGKNKYKIDKSLRDAYKIYLSKFNLQDPLSKFSDVSDRVKPMNWVDYKKNALTTLNKLMNRILYKSETFYVPYNLGIIRVKKAKMNIGLLNETNNLKIDWGHFQKTGKIIKHLNDHRDNYRYGFYWLCKKGPKGKTYYKFQALRIHRRKLGELLINTNIDYFE